MVLLTEIVRETAESFGLGNKAGALVAEAVRILFNPLHGGLRGFLDHLDREGLAPLTESWLDSKQKPRALDGMQLESVIGGAAIAETGKKLGLANARVRTAMAFAIPRLVGYFTAGGFIPSAIPNGVQSFLDSEEARMLAPAPRPPLSRADSRSPGPRLGWTLGVLALIVTGGMLGHQIWKHQSQEKGAPVHPVAETLPPVTRPAAAPVPEPEPGRPEARLVIRNDNGHFEFSGSVNSAEIKSAIMNQLVTFFGPSRLTGNLTVDPPIAPPAWLSRLDRVLPQLNVPGLDLRLEGHAVRLGGWLTDRDKENVLQSLRMALGTGYRFTYLGDEAAQLTSDARAATVAALDSLPFNYQGQDLVNALNQWVIRFPEGKSAFPEDLELTRRVSQLIASMPQPVIIEIGGHAIGSESGAENQRLSRERAESVRGALVQAGVPGYRLLARGYGGQNPVASNDTPYGRFRNERIEFKVIQTCDAGSPCATEQAGTMPSPGAPGLVPPSGGTENPIVPAGSGGKSALVEGAAATRPGTPGEATDKVPARKPKPRPKPKAPPVQKPGEESPVGEAPRAGSARGRWIPQTGRPSSTERTPDGKRKDATGTAKSGSGRQGDSVDTRETARPAPPRPAPPKPKPRPPERHSTPPAGSQDLF